jgi:hypothetical protein
MGLLPELLSSLDAAGLPVPSARFTRVHPTSPEARKLSEANWDDIICANLPSLADALRAASVIAEDSTLLLLGRQVDAVDLVFAEIPKSQDDDGNPDPDNLSAIEPRRLVLLEDKLVRNPEAKRQVLAQLLDYSQRAQHTWTTDTLCHNIKGPVGAWLRLHASRIDVMLAQGEMLLIIAGDDIDEDLLRLARRFAAGADPLSLSELCLVSLAVYRRGDERLLIPHVVSAVERHQRQLSIRVTVKGSNGAVLAATVEHDDEADVAAARRGAAPTPPAVEEFLARAKRLLDPKLSSNYTVTGGERKVLAYWLDDEARIKIHFGGFVRDVWSPIQVGLYVESAARRDAWLARVEDASSRGRLPVGTAIRASGKKTVEALKSFTWSTPSDLNESLLQTVTAALLEFAEAFTEPPPGWSEG